MRNRNDCTNRFPKKIPAVRDDDMYDDYTSTVSATECTGLIPRGENSVADRSGYESLNTTSLTNFKTGKNTKKNK